MAEPRPRPTEADDEPSIGELVSRLVDDGKAYAKAEIDLVRAIAAAKANAARMPLALLAVALLLALAAIIALCVGIVLALAALMPPLLAGLVAFLLIAGLAALLGWAGVRRLKDLL